MDIILKFFYLSFLNKRKKSDKKLFIRTIFGCLGAQTSTILLGLDITVLGFSAGVILSLQRFHLSNL